MKKLEISLPVIKPVKKANTKDYKRERKEMRKREIKVLNSLKELFKEVKGIKLKIGSFENIYLLETENFDVFLVKVYQSKTKYGQYLEIKVGKQEYSDYTPLSEPFYLLDIFEEIEYDIHNDRI